MRYTTEERERVATVYEANCNGSAPLIEGASGSQCGFKLLTVDLGDDETKNGFLTEPPAYLPTILSEESATIDGVPIYRPGGITSDSDTFTKFTPTFTASYNFPEDAFEASVIDSVLSYFTYSRGFKAGGFVNFEKSQIKVSGWS